MQEIVKDLVGEIAAHLPPTTFFKISQLNNVFRQNMFKLSIKEHDLEQIIKVGNMWGLVHLKPEYIETDWVWLSHFHNYFDLIEFFERNTIHSPKNFHKAALHGACAGGHLDLFKRIVDKCEDFHGGDHKIFRQVNHEYYQLKGGLGDGCTNFIQAAAHGGNLEIVKILIERYGTNQNSAIMCESAYKGNLDLIRYMIDTFYKTNPTANIEQAYCTAFVGAQIEVIEFFEELGIAFNEGCWRAACCSNNIDFIKKVVARCGEHQCSSEIGAICAAQDFNYDLLRYMCNRGASNYSRYLDELIYERFVFSKHLNLVEFLIEKGAHISEIILSSACIFRKTELLEYLCKKNNIVHRCSMLCVD